jgi:uncharacterized protein YbcI
VVKQHVGRGPDRVLTTLRDDLVICLLEGGFTSVEHALAGVGKTDLVTAARAALHVIMREALIEVIQTSMHRDTTSVLNAVDVAANLQTEIFVLGPRLSTDPPPGSATKVRGILGS